MIKYEKNVILKLTLECRITTKMKVSHLLNILNNCIDIRATTKNTNMNVIFQVVHSESVLT